MWAVPRGLQAHGNHAVYAGKVGKRHMLAQTSVVCACNRPLWCKFVELDAGLKRGRGVSISYGVVHIIDYLLNDMEVYSDSSSDTSSFTSSFLKVVTS